MLPSRAASPWFTEHRARRSGWLFIAAAVLVVYWPLSTFHYTTDGGDTFDCWLAWRHFITLSLKNGQLPLWNPLQQMGYPVYADLQGPAWYPEAIAIGGTIGHSIWTLQGLFLFYVIIGGIGFMRLCIVVHDDARLGVVTGSAYALCGFMAAHQMHFYAIISAAWMPWFLAAQMKLMRAPHWRNALEAAVLMMLLLTGGNHTFTIIAAYLLPFLFAVHALDHWKRGERRSIGSMVVHELLFVGFTVILACGTFYAWIEVSPFLGRMHGLAYEQSSEGPFNPTALPTLLFPALFGKNDWSIGTHPAMANGYMGVLVLAFAGIALFRRRTAVENVFGAFGVICLLLSFADDLPLHRFVWRWLPGMNVFRFPSYFLYFTVLGTLLLAAGSMKEGVHWRWGARRSQLFGLGCLLVLGTALLVFLPERFPPAAADVLRRSLFERVRALGYGERILIGWAITAPVLVLGVFLAWRKKLTPLALLVLVLVEMGWNTHLCIWNTASSDLHPAAIDARLSQQTTGPVIPDLRPLSEHQDSGERLHYLWRNTQTFLGQPSRVGFNSFWPAHTDSLINSHPDLAEAMDKQPFVYLTQNLVNEIQLDHLKPDSSTVFVPWMDEDGRTTEQAALLGPNALHCSPDDRIEITEFDYGTFAFRTHTRAPTFLVVQQTWFPGWTIRIDDVRTEVVRANVAAFGAFLPAGDHRVDVRFEKPLAPWLMGISMTAFVAALFTLAFAWSGQQRTWRLAGATALGSMIAWSLLAHGGPRSQNLWHPLHAWPAPDPRDSILYTAPGPTPWKLHQGHEYSPAWSIKGGDLRATGHRSLFVDVRFEALGRCKGLLVIQRTMNGKTTDYEAVRFLSSDTLLSGYATWSVARDVREFRFPEEEVAIYLWNQGPDTLVVSDMRIRTSPGAVRNE